MFRQAYIDGIIIKDVSQGIFMPATVEGERRPLTEQEREAVLKTAETHRAGLWVLTMFYAGLRPEETVPLMWNDIDLTEGHESITVQRAAMWVHGRAEIKGVKGKDKKKGEQKRRTIPIPPPLAVKLRSVPHKSLYVFTPAESEGMLTNSNLVNMWDSFHREVDLLMGAKTYRNKITIHAFPKEITPYYLRHTYATELFQMGVDLKTAQYLLGHEDISTTANIYTHFVQKSVDQAGDIIRGHFQTRGQFRI
jgi:integrase